MSISPTVASVFTESVWKRD